MKYLVGSGYLLLAPAGDEADCKCEAEANSDLNSG